jgi:hypothetical protein
LLPKKLALERLYCRLWCIICEIIRKGGFSQPDVMPLWDGWKFVTLSFRLNENLMRNGNSTKLQSQMAVSKSVFFHSSSPLSKLSIIFAIVIICSLNNFLILLIIQIFLKTISVRFIFFQMDYFFLINCFNILLWNIHNKKKNSKIQKQTNGTI